MYQVKLPLPTWTSHRVPIHVLVASPLIQLPGSVAGKAEEPGPIVWIPTTHVGTEEDSSSWLLPGPALAVVIIWEVNKQMEVFSLTPSSSNSFK